ncbi:sensor histidine kinase [Maribacter sp. Asnod1-A12]|uniref:sensor histidine kinase n=1 Tax=Maribacter sp. Asnod1-A12 TaxID=3160576 RepID=UPI003864111C
MNVIDFKYLEIFIFTAIFGVFAIYHLISFLILRHKILLYYFILILGITLHWSLYIFIYKATNDQALEFIVNISLITAMISTFGLLNFTKNYLNISKSNHPKLSRYYKILIVITVSLSVLHGILNFIFNLNLLSDFLKLIAAITAMSGIFLNIFSGYRLYNEEKVNKYYLYAYTPLLIASALYIGTWLIKKYFNIYTDHTLLITSALVVLQLILFSILISFKFKFIEVDNIKMQIETNKQLKVEVDKQTKNLQIAKKELEIKNEELETVNKLKTKLFSLLTHDVRGPLNNVGTIMGMIEVELADGPLKKFTNKLKNDVNDRISMVNALLDWSYKQLDGVTLNKKTCELNAIFTSISKEFKWLAEDKNIEIVLELSGHKIFIDENMLKVILRNLTSNAIKFSKKGQHVILSSKYNNDSIELTVTDFGQGMSTDWNNNKPEVRKGTKGEIGTGFGLMITTDFVKMNGGEMICESEINKGTTFTLRFKASLNDKLI